MRFCWIPGFCVLLIALCLNCGCAATSSSPADGLLFGTLQCDPGKAAMLYGKGITVSTFAISWNQFEQQEARVNQDYVVRMKRDLEAYRKAGMKVVLDFGLQYPPAWVFRYPHSRFINQYGDAYNEDHKPGSNGVNAVFNQVMREKQQRYIAQVFKTFGTDFYAVRLGGGYYGELCYPLPEFKGKKTCFWGYDAVAQGKILKPLPKGMKPCPVPVWRPGMESKDHQSAKQFIKWYMDSMQNYHDWQLAMTRKLYSGPLIMMYPSWGVRPGQIEDAVSKNLFSANGEITRGYDFRAFILGIKDPDVIVYTTWLDSNPEFGDDNSDNPARWCPIHYLAWCAADNPLKLRVWGENTGRGDLKAMQLSFDRMKRYNLMGVVWAFEPDLFSGKYATLEEFANLIKASKKSQ